MVSWMCTWNSARPIHPSLQDSVSPAITIGSNQSLVCVGSIMDGFLLWLFGTMVTRSTWNTDLTNSLFFVFKTF